MAKPADFSKNCVPFQYLPDNKNRLRGMRYFPRLTGGIFFFLGLLASTCLHGQEITISEELPMRSEYAYFLIGWVDGDLLLFRDKGHEYFIQAFDEELHVKWERELDLGDHRSDIIGIVAEKDRFHLIYGIHIKGDYFLYDRSYAHDVSLMDTMQIGKLESVYLTPMFQMKESEDETKIVLSYEEDGTLQIIGYDLINHAVTRTQGIKMSGTNLVRDYSNMIVSNDGDFYLTMKTDRSTQKKESLEIFCSARGSEEVIHQDASLGENQVYDYFPVYDNIHHHLVITGLYSDHNTSRALGFYFITYQPDNFTMNLLPFDESLLADVNGKEVSTTKGLSDFNVRKVALQQDGGAVIIAELNREFSRRSSLPMQGNTSAYGHGGWVDYYYEDLILFAVHPDGTEHWKDVLRKRQYSQDDDAIYSSFFLFKTPTRLRFLFNDEIKQENTVGGYEVTGTGHVERKTVFNTDYQRLKLRFKDGMQLAYNECIVPSERNGRLSLVRIVFNEDSN